MQAQSIAVGIVFNQRQQILISKRNSNEHLPGYWEFPGGKVEAGESFKLALRRELAEEIGITVNSAIKFIELRHDYYDRHLHFQFFKVLNFSDEIQACEDQQLRWVSLNELNAIQFPQANRAVINALTLPAYYMIADEKFFDKNLVSSVRRQLENGVNVIQHRADRDTDKSSYLKNANEIKKICQQYSAKFIMNCPLEWIVEDEFCHIHLSSELLKKVYTNGKNSFKHDLFSASCHDETEVKMANELDVRCILIGAVNPTESHPNGAVLGWKRFSELCFYSHNPVYALGGMQLDDYKNALMYGAQGVAAIRAFAD